ncbi:MAG: hypothetical protein J1E82_04260 [Muribaculaceae bacterium]|nr:hypothetical protein [Muribaculaceae bacterium]
MKSNYNIKTHKQTNLRRRLRSGVLTFNILLGSLLFLFPGCVDDKLIENKTESGFSGDDAEELTLTFTVDAGQIVATRADGDYEINTSLKEGNIDYYIDTDNKFQVLFLDSHGNFIFEPSGDNLQVAPTGDNNGRWRVTIYMNGALKDPAGKSILGLIKEQLEKDNFKIAVIANWSKDTNGDAYKLDWGWKNSILYKNKYEKASDEDKVSLKETYEGEPDLKTINDLHHLEVDSDYAKDSRKKAYSFIMDGDKMGVNTQWVQMREVEGKESLKTNDDAWKLKTKPVNSPSISANANAWIKNNWDPALDNLDENIKKATIYRHYRRLWQLWNLGGSFSDTELPYSKFTSKFGDAWKNRNGNDFVTEKWCLYDNHWIPTATEANGLQSVDGLTVVSAPSKTTENNNSYVRSYNGTKSETNKRTGYYGLILPKMNSGVYGEGSVADKKPWIKTSADNAYEYIKFEAPGTGTLRVLFSSLDDNEATFVVQRGANWEMSYKTSGTDVKEIGKGDTNTKFGMVLDPFSENVGYQIKMTGDPEDIILYSYSGSVIIYAIEFVCDDYLSGTDRKGIIPTFKYPIPMYGVQEYSKITNWGENTLLTLDEPISLIRALAKVELYLPAGTEFSHIYLRCMNRKSRCEPMDVMTSTGSLWKSHVDGEGECEWFRINNHEIKFNGNFYDWFGWFYGTWKTWNWSGLPESFTDSNESPHLFNPDVVRSDFCHFIKDENYYDGVYHRYFLYVPDKNISDPNSEGDLSSSPKVCHIEYRRADQSEYLDDNDCQRIYFTDYSSNDVIKRIPHDRYEYDYEQDEYNLNLNWPIMRNHIYRFYVGGNNSPQDIRVKVIPWEVEDPKIYEW